MRTSAGCRLHAEDEGLAANSKTALAAAAILIRSLQLMHLAEVVAKAEDEVAATA
jgi:hypothetical protein